MNVDAYFTEIIGYCAAVLTTFAFLPQAIQSWRSRDLSGISLGMYSLFTFGVGLWLFYGIIINKWPIILANATPFCISAKHSHFKIAAYLSSQEEIADYERQLNAFIYLLPKPIKQKRNSRWYF
jgi:MtN3 and saliva related transmembrane protein